MNKLLKIIENYPPELKLLLVCCGSERWAVEELLPATTPTLKGDSPHTAIDWEQFYKWIRRHRVTPVVYRYIKKNPAVLPEEVVQWVEDDQRRITKRALLLTGELVRIGKLLDKNNIPWFCMKGPVLAMQLYKDVAARDYRDIDLFIKEEDIEKAYYLIKSSGYKSKYKAKYTIHQAKKVSHNIGLFNFDKKVSLELHYRLYFNQKFSYLNYKSFFNDLETIQISNYSIKLPKTDLNFSFIIEHSANHGFSDLQWIIDARAILKNKIELQDRLFSDVCTTLSDLIFKNNSDKLLNKKLKPSLLLIKHHHVNFKKKLLILIFGWRINNRLSFKIKMITQPILRRYYWIKNRFINF